MKKIYTPDEIAAGLIVSKKTIYKWLNDGELKGFKVGSMWRVKKSELESFIGQDIPWENGNEDN